MQFQYTLQRDEYLDYCKYELLGDKDIDKLRKRVMPVLPVSLVFLFVIFRLTHWAFYVGAVILSILWFFAVNYMTARIIRAGAKDRCDKVGDKAFRPLRLIIDEGSLEVNGKRQILNSYRMFTNLILLFLVDGSTVILPARVIGGEDAAHISPVLLELDRCMGK